MKKVKLLFNFLSAANMVFGSIAVLFTPELAPISCRKVPFFPRR